MDVEGSESTSSASSEGMMKELEFVMDMMMVGMNSSR